MAKNTRGERLPYVASRKWVDGSIADDLPAKRLARLYGVNHFITSQTNPVVLWAIRDSGRRRQPRSQIDRRLPDRDARNG